MVNRHEHPMRLGLALLVGAALAGCGGGGGGDDPNDPSLGDVVVTTRNLDEVTRVAVVAMLGSAATHNGSTLTMRGADTQAGLLGAARAAVQPVGRRIAAAQLRPAAVLAPLVEDCSYGGTRTYTVDDVDDSRSLTLGDKVSVAHVACRDDPFEASSGVIALTVTQVRLNPLGVVAAARFDGFTVSDATSTRRQVLDGAFTLALEERDADTTTLRVEVTDTLTLQITHPLYTDTLSLWPGFVIDTTLQLASPNYQFQPVSYVEVSGTLRSASLGGTLLLWTPTGHPATLVGDEQHPRAGYVQVQSRGAVVNVQVQGSSGVHVDASFDNGGTASRDLAWDTLL